LSVYLTGEFREREPLIAAIGALHGAGFGAEELDLFSAEPVELPRGVLDRPTRISLAAVASAIVFGALATAFIYYTQSSYRIVTGGMPLFSFWATGVITYEMTMLGAIVAAFAWFVWESGLLRRRTAPVPAVEPGSIWLRVRCRTEEAGGALDALRGAGAMRVARSEA